MASKNKSGNFDIKNILLIVYITICVLMVVVTMGLSFIGTGDATINPTATTSATLPPAVQTLQAEEYQPVDVGNHGSGGRNAQSGVNRHTNPDATAVPETTPDS